MHFACPARAARRCMGIKLASWKPQRQRIFETSSRIGLSVAMCGTGRLIERE